MYVAEYRDLANGGSQGGYVLLISISKPNKVQTFQFQTSGILLFADIQNFG